MDEAGGNEPTGSDEVDDRTEDGFKRVHFVNLRQSYIAERSEHEDADAGAEIAAINGDEELENDCEPNGAFAAASLGPVAWFGCETLQQSLREEQESGEEYQEGDKASESFVAGIGQQDASDQSAEQTDRQEPPQPGADRSEVPAITKNSAERADDQRESAGGIGNYGGGAKSEQGWEGHQGAASRDGVDRASRDGCKEECCYFSRRHAAQSRVLGRLLFAPTEAWRGRTLDYRDARLRMAE
jgi:hypothetical protein